MSAVDEKAVAAVRHFNRFYTRRLGLLNERQFDTEFSLTEMRVLYELAHRPDLSAADLVHDLDLDAGYVSRMIGRFERRGLIRRCPSPADRRKNLIALTLQGREAFAPLDRHAREAVAAMLAPLSAPELRQVADCVGTIEDLLQGRPACDVTLRPPRPGDMGLVVSQHGTLYAEEYGWDATFEGLVAGIVAEFAGRFDPDCERCWIADRAGEFVGSVFLVRACADVAKLRLLLVAPSARGHGIGRKLVDECVAFAREVGYRRIVLWTNSCLLRARALYERAGFRLVASEFHRSFGQDLVGGNVGIGPVRDAPRS